MCKDYVEYKNFDELPGELKEKFKSRASGSNLKKAKDGYIGFINLLNQRGDGVIGEYSGNSTKTQVRFAECSHVTDISPKVYKRGHGCAVCNGRQVQRGVNDLVTTHQHLAKEWHPTKNELTPHEVTQGSNKKVWWQCEQGHEWKQSVGARTYINCNCPYCSNHKVLKGYNDIATTHSQYVTYFVNIDDSYTHTHNSNKKSELRCPECGNIKNMRIADLTRKGFSCSICSDGISYPEKLMSSILAKLNIEFVKQLSYDNGEHRHDFYLPQFNAILETHGLQHYEQGFKKFGKTLEEEQANDRYKRELAVANGILNENYHEVDCRYSTLEWCRPNIEKALSNYIDMTALTDEDWKQADIQAQKSLKVKACKYWKENKEANSELTPMQVANVFGINNSTICGYLNWGNINGLCVYDAQREKEVNDRRNSTFVYLIKQSGEPWFNEPMSMNELSRQTGISHFTIRNVLDKGTLKYNNRAKYDPKYIGSRIVSAEVYDSQTQSN